MLRSVLAGAALSLVLSGAALAADNNFPTPGGATAVGAVVMCLNPVGQAVACNAGGQLSALNITTAKVVKASAGRLARIDVIVAGSAAGTANDTTTTGAAAAANEVFAIPNTVGTYYLDWPMANGIVIVPGTGQTVAVSYN